MTHPAAARVNLAEELIGIGRFADAGRIIARRVIRAGSEEQ
jgi:hypothetical protein